MLLPVPIFGPSYAQIMLVFANYLPLDLKIIRSAKWEKQVQKHITIVWQYFLVSQAPRLLYFAVFVLNQRCLAIGRRDSWHF